LAILSLAIPAGAQTPSTLPVPDWLLYRALFSQVLGYKAMLDHDDALGIVDTAKARKAERDRMGLTVNGYNSLVSIGADFLAAEKAYPAQRGQILKATQAAAAANAPLPSNDSTTLRVQDEVTAQAYIDKLHAGLGDSHFAALDAFARRVVLPKVFVRPMKQR
jgi:hypothetical protein